MSAIASCENRYNIFFFNPSKCEGLFAKSAKTPLQKKVEYVCQAILTAAKIVKDRGAQAGRKSLFVLPEDVFGEEYHTKSEKREFKAKMIALAQQIGEGFIIVPGTFNWVSTKDEKRKFHKTAYLLHDHEVAHYNKRHFHPLLEYRALFNDGFGDTHANFEHKEGVPLSSSFCSKTNPRVLIAGLNVVVEICFDNIKGDVREQLASSSETGIDLHLLLSNGTNKDMPLFPEQERPFVSIHSDLGNFNQIRVGGISSAEQAIEHFDYDFLAERFIPGSVVDYPPVKTPDVKNDAEKNQLFKEYSAIIQRTLEEKICSFQDLRKLLDTFWIYRFGQNGDFETPKKLILQLIHWDIYSDASHQGVFICLVEDYFKMLFHHLLIDKAIADFQEFLSIRNEADVLNAAMAPFCHFGIEIKLIHALVTLPLEYQNNALLRDVFNQYWDFFTSKMSPELKVDFVDRLQQAFKKSGNIALATELSYGYVTMKGFRPFF